VIWANLTPNEDWALLSGVAQRLTCPCRVGNRLCFVCHSASLRLRKRRFNFQLRPGTKNTREYPRERPGRCSIKLGRLDKRPEIPNGRHVSAGAQGSWNTLMRQRHRFAHEELMAFAAQRICATAEASSRSRQVIASALITKPS
jgi:hypothetical protein